MYQRRGSAGDFLEDYQKTRDRVRRLELRPLTSGAAVGAVKTYENWIVSPPTVRYYPVGFITAGNIIGFKWAVPVGFIDVSFYLNGGFLHSTGIVGGTGGFILPTPQPVVDDDQIQPRIVAVYSNATDATMSFLLDIG